MSLRAVTQPRYRRPRTPATDASPLYSSVLVALDGSPLAAQALPHAVEIARVFGIPLVLLRVLLQDDGQVDVSREHEAHRSQAEGYMEALRRALAHTGISIQTRIEDGQAVEAILNALQRIPGGLLVITALGRSASGPLGRVAEELTRSAPGHVLLVKPQQ